MFNFSYYFVAFDESVNQLIQCLNSHMLIPSFRWFCKQKPEIARMSHAKAHAKHSARLSTAAAAHMGTPTHVNLRDTPSSSRMHAREHTATPMTTRRRRSLVHRQITSSHFAPAQPGM